MIKALFHITALLFSISLNAHGSRSASNESVVKKEVAADLLQACAQNKMQYAGASAELKAVCSCSVEKLVTFVFSANFSNKNPSERVAWLKKYYLKELSQAELDQDPFDIFEFAVPINEECLVKAKIKK